MRYHSIRPMMVSSMPGRCGFLGRLLPGRKECRLDRTCRVELVYTAQCWSGDICTDLIEHI